MIKWTILMTFMLTQTLSALTSKVVLQGGADAHIKGRIENALTKVLNSLEEAKWDSISSEFTPAGMVSLKELYNQTMIINVNPLYETELLALPGGGWEVRNIKVLLSVLLKGQVYQGNPYQYIVFSFNQNGLISDVRFAIDREQYENVFESSDELDDISCRQQILEFIETFRTAYNRKDIDLLKKIYSEDALIIVGRVLKQSLSTTDFLASSHFTRDRIQFIRQSKQEYITRLAQVFDANEYIKVSLSDIAIRRHPKFSYIYGVTLKQDWKSTTYVDSGWLFLMIDFKIPDQPVIHVRSWQPERFSDGSVVSLGDFEIIE